MVAKYREHSVDTVLVKGSSPQVRFAFPEPLPRFDPFDLVKVGVFFVERTNLPKLIERANDRSPAERHRPGLLPVSRFKIKRAF
jgi:hypothetical protein